MRAREHAYPPPSGGGGGGGHTCAATFRGSAAAASSHRKRENFLGVGVAFDRGDRAEEDELGSGDGDADGGREVPDESETSDWDRAPSGDGVAEGGLPSAAGALARVSGMCAGDADVGVGADVGVLCGEPIMEGRGVAAVDSPFSSSVGSRRFRAAFLARTVLAICSEESPSKRETERRRREACPTLLGNGRG